MVAQKRDQNVLPPGAFTKLKTLDEVVARLFGEFPIESD
jgi:hypothetical protein